MYNMRVHHCPLRYVKKEKRASTCASVRGVAGAMIRDTVRWNNLFARRLHFQFLCKTGVRVRLLRQQDRFGFSLNDVFSFSWHFMFQKLFRQELVEEIYSNFLCLLLDYIYVCIYIVPVGFHLFIFFYIFRHIEIPLSKSKTSLD